LLIFRSVGGGFYRLRYWEAVAEPVKAQGWISSLTLKVRRLSSLLCVP
jgi:hypothetical protein